MPTEAPTGNSPAFVVRDFEGKEVHRVDLTPGNLCTSNRERVLSGLLRKTDLDRFYVDESEVDAALVCHYYT